MSADNDLGAPASPSRSPLSMGGRRDPNEVIANARLIAASPELLEAAAAWVSYLDSPLGDEEDFDGEQRLMDALRAAIAKATGSAA